jgi:membrane-associated protease RseP (regulator of RpoE activity)
LSDRLFGLNPPDPFPPAVPEVVEPLGAEGVRDSIDTFVLAHLTAPRFLQVAEKRILRGKVDGPPARREQFARRLRELPVDAFFETVGADTFATVSRPKSRRIPTDWPRYLVFFLLTVFTTTWGGAYWNGIDPFAGSTWGDPDLGAILNGLRAGLPYSMALVGILACHEFGHYFAARRYGLDTTLPFFIPIPPFFFLLPIGTLGAVIKMNTPLYNRRILMDVGAAGPLAGMVAALPILGYGILRAPAIPETQASGLYFSEPLLFTALEFLLRPDLRAGGDIQATSAVLAGWIGLFVTALNLLPVGQLDGGHVTYALLGRGQHRLGRIFFLALAALGFLWSGWWLWVVIILLVVRIKHPPVLDLELPLDGKRKAIGWITVALFLLCFHPVPFQLR